MASKAGGGPQSNKVVRSSAPKTEPRAHAVSETAVSRLGNMVGNHADKGTVPSKAVPLYEGRGYSEPRGPTNMLAEGPGAGRTIHKCGSQSALPAATPMPKGRGILNNE